MLLRKNLLNRGISTLFALFALFANLPAQEVSVGLGAAFLRSAQKENGVLPPSIASFASSLNYKHPISKQWAWSSSLLFVMGEGEFVLHDEFSAPQKRTLKVRNGLLSTGISWCQPHLQNMTFGATVEAGAEYTTSYLERASDRAVIEQVKKIIPVFSFALEEQYYLPRFSIGLRYRFLLPIVPQRSDTQLLQDGGYGGGHLITAILLFHLQ